MTNADGIRQLTDKELAAFLIAFDRCIICQIECTKENRCNEGIIAWLKQEVNEYWLYGECKDADSD